MQNNINSQRLLKIFISQAYGLRICNLVNLTIILLHILPVTATHMIKAIRFCGTLVFSEGGECVKVIVYLNTYFYRLIVKYMVF